MDDTRLPETLAGDEGEFEPGILPPGCRVYAIGDVHGQMPLLLHLYEVIREDANTDRAQRTVVIHLGDYIDRGRRGRDVIDLLSGRPLAGFETVFLRGNHEHMLLKGFYDDCAAPGWLYNGGEKTLSSYGVYPEYGLQASQCIPDMMTQLRQALPERHLSFLKNTKLYHREGGYVFAHAGIRPGVPLAKQSPEDLVWIRDGFLDCEVPLPYVVVHGHTPIEHPRLWLDRINVDTGAFSTGRLTCVVLEGDDRRMLSVTGRPV